MNIYPQGNNLQQCRCTNICFFQCVLNGRVPNGVCSEHHAVACRRGMQQTFAVAGDWKRKMHMSALQLIEGQKVTRRVAALGSAALGLCSNADERISSTGKAHQSGRHAPTIDRKAACRCSTLPRQSVLKHLCCQYANAFCCLVLSNLQGAVLSHRSNHALLCVCFPDVLLRLC